MSRPEQKPTGPRRGPRIYFCGDNHGRFDHIVEAVLRDKPDAVILLGDIEASRPLDVELAPIMGKTIIRFIHGNHDTDSDLFYRGLWESKMADCNLDGRVEDIAGVRIAGLGGNFKSKVWTPPTEPEFASYEDWLTATRRTARGRDLSDIVVATQVRTHRSTIFPDVYNRLSLAAADVLVTHEAPSAHPHGFEALDDLTRALGVEVSFHGHHHDRLDYRERWPSIGFEAHGVGFCGITDLDGEVVRIGDHDDFRSRGWA